MPTSPLRARRSFVARYHLIALAIVLAVAATILLQRSGSVIPASQALSSGVVISQLYGGAGCGTANCSTYKNDYIELFNRGTAAVSLNGLSVQYGSATGTSVTNSTSGVTPLPNVSLQPGQYFLISESGAASANGVTALPTPDVAGGSINMAAGAGKVFLVNGTTAITLDGTTGCPTTPANVIDFVGYGTTANCFEGAGRAPAPSTTTADFRAANGCTETDNNNTDFATAAPSPRNSTTTLNPCGGAPGAPSLSVTDVTQAEGNSGTTTFTFTVNLSAPAPSTVSFDIATADGTAQDDNPATEDNDYVAKSETGRTIAAGASSATFTVSVNGDTATEPNETFFVNVTNVTGGGVTVGDAQGLGTITNDDITTTAIYAIQGSNMSSPINGATVTTTGIVTGRRSLGATNNGFYIQDPAGDGNVNTSDAILVFTGSTVPTVNVGDSVQVTGTVTEFESSTTDEPDGVSPPDPKTATELVGPFTINVLSSGNVLPAALSSSIFDPAALSRGAELEKYEYMRVSVASLTVCEPTNNFGEFWGVVTGRPRPFREPGIERGDPVPVADNGPYANSTPPNVPVWDGNFERIMVDSGAGLVASGSTRRAQVQVTTGTIVTGIEGPLDYAFDNYRIVLDYNITPGTSGGVTAAVPVPTPNAGEFTIASANLENFTNNATRLNKASLAIRNVMRTPDIIGLIEILDQATLTALANKVNADAASPSTVNYQAFLSETAATQDIGYLVNTARVTLVGTPTAQFVGKQFTYAGETDDLHDRPPFILTADVPQSSGTGTFRVTIILNHTKSLIAVDSPRPRGAGGTEGGRNREKRRLQAEDIADLIQARQNENLVVMGDFNAFDFNDGLGDVIGTIKGTPAPPEQVVEPSADRWTYQLFNSLYRLPADQQYSLLFEGNAQALDHILLNENMRVRQTRFAYGRYNADFSESFAADANRPERLSDHDSAVSYFLTTPVPQPGAVLISECRLNGPGGAADEFIELYNNSDTLVSLNGWTLAAPGGGTVALNSNASIGARGHYLVAENGYSVSGYPADGSIFTAVPDTGYTGGMFPDDGGVQLKDNNGNVIDAVGFSSANGTGFREGAGLAPLSAPAAGDQYSFVRKLTTGLPQDTNDNAADFVLVSTSGAVGGIPTVLGAPGPETTQSPVQRNGAIKASNIDTCTGAGICENRRRIGTPVPNGAYGTLKIRRKFTNTTVENVTRLRFRVVDITTLNSPGYVLGNSQADLRVVPSDSGNFTVTLSTGESVSVAGTQVETPPAQPLGGGMNSSIVLVTPVQIAPGASINIEFNLGVQQGGSFRFFVNVEALTADTTPPPAAGATKTTLGKKNGVKQ